MNPTSSQLKQSTPARADTIIQTIFLWSCCPGPFVCLMTIHLCRHWWIRTIYRPMPGLKNSLTQHNPKLSFFSLSADSPRAEPVKQPSSPPARWNEDCYFYALTTAAVKKKNLDRAILPLGRARMDECDLPQRQHCRGCAYLIQEAMLNRTLLHLSQKINPWKQKYSSFS